MSRGGDGVEQQITRHRSHGKRHRLVSGQEGGEVLLQVVGRAGRRGPRELLADDRTLDLQQVCLARLQRPCVDGHDSGRHCEGAHQPLQPQPKRERPPERR